MHLLVQTACRCICAYDHSLCRASRAGNLHRPALSEDAHTTGQALLLTLDSCSMQASDCSGMHAIASFLGWKKMLLCAISTHMPIMMQVRKHKLVQCCKLQARIAAEASLGLLDTIPARVMSHLLRTSSQALAIGVSYSGLLHCIVLCCVVLNDAHTCMYLVNTMCVMCRSACHGCNGCWSAPCDSCRAVAVPLFSLQGVPDNQRICGRQVQGCIQAPD